MDMPEIVKPSMGKRLLGLLPGFRIVVSPDQFPDERRDGVRVDRLAESSREHVVIDAHPLGPSGEPYGALTSVVILKYLSGLLVDADHAIAHSWSFPRRATRRRCSNSP
jgi:hypothetical protein